MSARFRLATVERLRAARLDEAGAGLQRAADALEAAVRHREALTAALHGSRTPGSATAHDLSTAAVHRDRLRAERATAAEEIDRCAGVLATARAAWLLARAELKAVESLHQRHREAVVAEQARREQQGLDEAAGVLATRRMIAAGRQVRRCEPAAGGAPR